MGIATVRLQIWRRFALIAMPATVFQIICIMQQTVLPVKGWRNIYSNMSVAVLFGKNLVE